MADDHRKEPSESAAEEEKKGKALKEREQLGAATEVMGVTYRLAAVLTVVLLATFEWLHLQEI